LPQNPSISHLNSENILQRAFEESDDRLRVDAEITAVISGPQEVSIDQQDDSIAIGDGSVLFTGTTVSGHHGLDVNIIGGVTNVTGNITTHESGLSVFQTTQYSVGTSVVQLTPTPLTNRTSISIRVTATGGNAVFIGNSSGTSTANGYPLYNGDTLQMDIDSSHQIWAIANAAGQTVYVLEMA
jgi:hypothetical protein